MRYVSVISGVVAANGVGSQDGPTIPCIHVAALWFKRERTLARYKPYVFPACSFYAQIGLNRPYYTQTQLTSQHGAKPLLARCSAVFTIR